MAGPRALRSSGDSQLETEFLTLNKLLKLVFKLHLLSQLIWHLALRVERGLDALPWFFIRKENLILLESLALQNSHVHVLDLCAPLPGFLLRTGALPTLNVNRISNLMHHYSSRCHRFLLTWGLSWWENTEVCLVDCILWKLYTFGIWLRHVLNVTAWLGGKGVMLIFFRSM